MALTVTLTPGKTWAQSNDPLTIAKLNQTASPTFTITGTMQTSDIAAGAVTSAKATPGPYFYVASSFASNAYTATFSPAPASLSDGLELYFKAAGSNTGAATLNPNSLGAKAIRKRYNLVLTPSDIRSGQIVGVRYDASNDWFQMITPTGNLAAPSVTGSFKNLLIKNTSGNEDTQMDITADALLLADTTGSTILVESLNVTANIAAGNVLTGLDTGVEAGSTWYYLWVLSSGAANSCVLSTSSTTPDATFLSNNSTYSFKALVGAIRNNASSNFIRSYQTGNQVFIGEGVVLSSKAAAVANTYEALAGADLTAFEAVVPPIAKTVRGRWGSKNASVTGTRMDIAPDATDSPGVSSLAIPGVTAAANPSGFWSVGPWEIALKTRNFYWRSATTDTNNTCHVTGYGI